MDFANDIPQDLARAAHQGTSFVPERRAQQEQQDFAATLRGDFEELTKLTDTGKKQAQLALKFERYRAGYRKRALALLQSEARCLSPMITGPGSPSWTAFFSRDG
jgi:hypothetical protein